MKGVMNVYKKGWLCDDNEYRQSPFTQFQRVILKGLSKTQMNWEKLETFKDFLFVLNFLNPIQINDMLIIDRE